MTAKGTTQVQIVGNDEVDDHGLEDTVKDSAGAAITVNYYYTNGSGKWICGVQSSTIPKKYNKSGTLTDLDIAKFGVFRYYVSKTDDSKSAVVNYFAVYDDEQYNNLADAQKAVTNNSVVYATNELAALEWAQLGFVIVDSSGVIKDVIVSKSTPRGSFANNTVNQAKLVTVDTSIFANTLSSTDTTVQQALDTLDDNTVNLVKDQTVGGVKTWSDPAEFREDVYCRKIVAAGDPTKYDGEYMLANKTNSEVFALAGDNVTTTYTWRVPSGAPPSDGLCVIVNKDGKMAYAEKTYYDNENAQDAVGTILTDGGQIDFTYDDATPKITAKLVDTKEWHYHVSLTSSKNNLLSNQVGVEGSTNINKYPDVPRTIYVSILSNNNPTYAGTLSFTGIDCNGDTVNYTRSVSIPRSGASVFTIP